MGCETVKVLSGRDKGKQDRVLSVSLVLPARSGVVPIAAFCVEQGRWSQRAGEDVKTFASADAVLPSRETKLAQFREPRLPERDRVLRIFSRRKREVRQRGRER